MITIVMMATSSIRADDDDAMEELEAVIVSTNEVQRNQQSQALEALIQSSRTNTRKKQTQDLKAADQNRRSSDTEALRERASDRAQNTLNEGGQQAQKIQTQSTRDILDREKGNSASEAFKNSLQYWTEEGVYNAGFEAGHEAGDKAFGTRGKHKDHYAPHHGRRDREPSSD